MVSAHKRKVLKNPRGRGKAPEGATFARVRGKSEEKRKSRETLAKIKARMAEDKRRTVERAERAEEKRKKKAKKAKKRHDIRESRRAGVGTMADYEAYRRGNPHRRRPSGGRRP